MKSFLRSAFLALIICASSLAVFPQMKPEEKKLLEAAQAAFIKGNFDNAISTLDDLLRKYPRNNAAFYLRGNLKLLDRRDLDGSLVDLQTALRLAPNALGVEKVYNDLGLVYQLRSQNEKALEFFEKAISKNPSYPPPHNGKAVILENKGRIDEALKEYEIFIKLEPNPIAGYIGRSHIRLTRRDLIGSLEDATKVVEGDQKFPSSWLRRGFVLCILGRWEQCVSDFRQGFELRKQPQYMFARVDVSFSDFQKYSEMFPKEANAYAALGLVNLFRMNEEIAASQFEKAYKLDPALESQLADLIVHIRRVRK